MAGLSGSRRILHAQEPVHGCPNRRHRARVRSRGHYGRAVAKKHGITPTTLFRWRKRFGGLDPSQAAELRQLQAENARLKKVVAQLALDNDILKELNAKKW